MKALQLLQAVIAGIMLWAAPSFAKTGGRPSELAVMKDLYRRSEAIPFAVGNPRSAVKEDLGKALCVDPILSGTRTVF